MNIFDDVLFAVTREDYKIEHQTIIERNYKKILTVCSGGCTPLSLKALSKNLMVTAFDINPHQLIHLNNKTKLIQTKKLKQLNAGFKGDMALNQSGKFEKMFQVFRVSFIKNITTESEIEELFNLKTEEKKRSYIILSWLKNPNIKTPFKKVFNDDVIESVFSKRATQHATPGTYIEYFFNKIMNSFKSNNFYKNPFLQHIFLGYYLKESFMPYINYQKKLKIKTFLGTVYDVPNIETYDLVSLSNLFDWCDAPFVKQCASYLSKLRSGSGIILRQLNNDKNWYPIFKDYFEEEASFNTYWKKNDRSMFYDHFRLFIKK
tara:strand:- start:914 stop:1870 length:957 start_codon:yes stop_codon:yes gene_type:complete